jgi:hypothetical protein
MDHSTHVISDELLSDCMSVTEDNLHLHLHTPTVCYEEETAPKKTILQKMSKV